MQKFKKSYMDEKYGVEEAEKIHRVGQVKSMPKWLTKESEARSLVNVGRSCGW